MIRVAIECNFDANQLDEFIEGDAKEMNAQYVILREKDEEFPEIGVTVHNCSGYYGEIGDLKKKLTEFTSLFPTYVFKFYYFTWDFEDLVMFTIKNNTVVDLPPPSAHFVEQEVGNGLVIYARFTPKNVFIKHEITDNINHFNCFQRKTEGETGEISVGDW